MNAAEIVGIPRKVFHSALQQGLRPYSISGGVMVKSDGNLNKSLQELFVVSGSGAPHVFENLVGFEKFRIIEEGDAACERIGFHASFWHSSAGIA